MVRGFSVVVFLQSRVADSCLFGPVCAAWREMVHSRLGICLGICWDGRSMSENPSTERGSWNTLWDLISKVIQRVEESTEQLLLPTLYHQLSAAPPPLTPSLQTPAHRLIYLDSLHASAVSEMLRIPLDRERLLYAKRAACLLACWRLEEMRRFVALHVNDAFDAHSTIFPFPDLDEPETYKWLVNKWWIHAGRAEAALHFEAAMLPPSYAE